MSSPKHSTPTLPSRNRRLPLDRYVRKLPSGVQLRLTRLNGYLDTFHDLALTIWRQRKQASEPPRNVLDEWFLRHSGSLCPLLPVDDLRELLTAVDCERTPYPSSFLHRVIQAHFVWLLSQGFEDDTLACQPASVLALRSKQYLLLLREHRSTCVGWLPDEFFLSYSLLSARGENPVMGPVRHPPLQQSHEFVYSWNSSMHSDSRALDFELARTSAKLASEPWLRGSVLDPNSSSPKEPGAERFLYGIRRSLVKAMQRAPLRCIVDGRPLREGISSNLQFVCSLDLLFGTAQGIRDVCPPSRHDSDTFSSEFYPHVASLLHDVEQMGHALLTILMFITLEGYAKQGDVRLPYSMTQRLLLGQLARIRYAQMATDAPARFAVLMIGNYLSCAAIEDSAAAQFPPQKHSLYGISASRPTMAVSDHLHLLLRNASPDHLWSHDLVYPSCYQMGAHVRFTRQAGADGTFVPSRVVQQCNYCRNKCISWQSYAGHMIHPEDMEAYLSHRKPWGECRTFIARFCQSCYNQMASKSPLWRQSPPDSLVSWMPWTSQILDVCHVFCEDSPYVQRYWGGTSSTYLLSVMGAPLACGKCGQCLGSEDVQRLCSWRSKVDAPPRCIDPDAPPIRINHVTFRPLRCPDGCVPSPPPSGPPPLLPSARYYDEVVVPRICQKAVDALATTPYDPACFSTLQGYKAFISVPELKSHDDCLMPYRVRQNVLCRWGPPRDLDVSDKCDRILAQRSTAHPALSHPCGVPSDHAAFIGQWELDVAPEKQRLDSAAAKTRKSLCLLCGTLLGRSKDTTTQYVCPSCEAGTPIMCGCCFTASRLSFRDISTGLPRCYRCYKMSWVFPHSVSACRTWLSGEAVSVSFPSSVEGLPPSQIVGSRQFIISTAYECGLDIPDEVMDRLMVCTPTQLSLPPVMQLGSHPNPPQILNPEPIVPQERVCSRCTAVVYESPSARNYITVSRSAGGTAREGEWVQGDRVLKCQLCANSLNARKLRSDHPLFPGWECPRCYCVGRNGTSMKVYLCSRCTMLHSYQSCPTVHPKGETEVVSIHHGSFPMGFYGCCHITASRPGRQDWCPCSQCLWRNLNVVSFPRPPPPQPRQYGLHSYESPTLSLDREYLGYVTQQFVRRLQVLSPYTEVRLAGMLTTVGELIMALSDDDLYPILKLPLLINAMDWYDEFDSNGRGWGLTRLHSVCTTAFGTCARCNPIIATSDSSVKIWCVDCDMEFRADLSSSDDVAAMYLTLFAMLWSQVLIAGQGRIVPSDSAGRTAFLTESLGMLHQYLYVQSLIESPTVATGGERFTLDIAPRLMHLFLRLIGPAFRSPVRDSLMSNIPTVSPRATCYLMDRPGAPAYLSRRIPRTLLANIAML